MFEHSIKIYYSLQLQIYYSLHLRRRRDVWSRLCASIYTDRPWGSAHGALICCAQFFCFIICFALRTGSWPTRTGGLLRVHMFFGGSFRRRQELTSVIG